MADNDHGRFIPVWRLEEALRYGLEGVVGFLGHLGFEPPYDVEFGVVVTKGYTRTVDVAAVRDLYETVMKRGREPRNPRHDQFIRPGKSYRIDLSAARAAEARS